MTTYPTLAGLYCIVIIGGVIVIITFYYLKYFQNLLLKFKIIYLGKNKKNVKAWSMREYMLR